MPAPDRAPTPRYLAVGMGELPDHDRWLTEPESQRLQSFAYTKRREEARLGRWTAKRAVAASLRLAEDLDQLREIVIRNAADGAPEVFLDDRPAPLNISMTDRADWAVCVVRDGVGAIGCDLELVEPRTARFVADYFTPAEQQAVAASPDDHDLLANLTWSAKESALKVLRTGLRRDTRSVEVTLIDEHDDHGWRALRVTTAEGTAFDGWWRRFGAFVLTYVGADASEPPASLVEPPPLAGAEPGHTWVTDPLRRRSPR